MFAVTAIDARGERLSESFEAEDLQAAQRELMSRGLMVLSLEPARSPAGVLASIRGARSAARPGAKLREVAVFARLMSMMLRAGASVVPAMSAIREQPGRPAFLALLADLAERVESGVSLHDAMARHDHIFSGAVRTVIAAGEATGSLAESFARLSQLLDARMRIRRTVVGALVYPAMLLMMAVGVTLTMALFVLPRFTDLFKMLNTPTPAVTQIMLDAGTLLREQWVWVVGGPVAAGAALWAWLRSRSGRELVSNLVLHVPVLGRAVSGVLLAGLLNIWAALLRSRVPLLETVREAREAVAHPRFRALVSDVETAITEGRTLSGVLKQSRLVPPTIVATLQTGEESGRLGESMEFVAAWLEEENDALIRSLTRALEPAILIFMGLLVGGVAIGLFLPLFDIATAAG
ncbi:MAG: type II secretion system F family protein [Planctomycetia bacterium]|nr:MAG: type II secretion system F family protein [Planctomycetia bacterium]